jgi:hypothetical protein
MNSAEPSLPRKRLYALLIVVAAAGIAGRLGSASLVPEPELHTNKRGPQDQRRQWPAQRPRPMPTFSSNDRSRWATVRALVDGDPDTGERGYAVGYRDRKSILASAVTPLAARNAFDAGAFSAAGYYVRTQKSDRGIIFLDGYQSVDKVLHPQKLEFYSTKPQLLSTLVAGLYWLVQWLTGWTLARDPFEVVRTILLLVNLLPMVIYLGLLARLVERYGTTDWGRLYVVTAACFATLMTPFAITLNNHTVATYSVVFALYPALAVWRGGPRSDAAWRFLVAGFFAAFTFTNEYPALSFAGLLFLALLWRNPRKTLLFFVPAGLVPLAGLEVTTYLATGQLRPTYSEFGGPWYEYEGSHWRKPVEGEKRSGIDWARLHEGRADYAFNLFLGHHGLFSLSPIWLFAVAGMAVSLRHLRSLRPQPPPVDTDGAPQVPGLETRVSSRPQTHSADEEGEPRTSPRRSELTLVGGMTLLLAVVVVSFYLVRSDNYGGWTNGLRWLMWLSPLWLLTMVPVMDWLAGRRWGRWLAYAFLAVTVFAVNYRLWNPWRHPWLYDLFETQGWISY